MIKGLRKILLMVVLAMVATMAWSAQTITYYHLDALGSPIAATNESGNIIWREAYEPYGKRIRNQAGTDSGIWFTGKEEDVGTGLIYYGARWYDPMVGRFMGVDPVGFSGSNPQSFNRFAYANNNPYKYVDPDGNSPLEWLFLVGDIASASANIAAGNWGGTAWDVMNIALDAVGPPGASEITHAAKVGKSAGKVADIVKSPVVIGEKMERVNQYAKKIGGITIDDWLSGRKWSPSLNDKFISAMKAEGRDIKDIGPAFDRRLRNKVDPSQGRGPSSVYGSERRDLKSYSNYERHYERKGKYQGGVSGLD